MEKFNKYCLNLNIDFDLNLDMLYDAQKHHKNRLDRFKQFKPMYSKNDTVGPGLHKYGVEILHMEVFYNPPGFEMPVHIDYDDVGYNHTKMNWIIGAAGSKMYWWEPKEGIEPEHYKTGIDTPYCFYKKEDCIQVWSAEVGFPSLVNVGVPHSVHNCTDEGRWCVSYVLKDPQTDKALQWDKAEQIFASLAQR